MVVRRAAGIICKAERTISRPSDAGGDDVEEDGEVVGGAASEDEHMPCGVEVAESVESEEDYAEGIGESAGGEPQNAVEVDGVKQWTRGEDNEPALKQVDERGCHGKPFDSETLEENAGNGECPFHSEECPTDGASQRDKREWGIGTGYQQVDGGMIEDLEHVSGASADQ